MHTPVLCLTQCSVLIDFNMQTMHHVFIQQCIFVCHQYAYDNGITMHIQWYHNAVTMHALCHGGHFIAPLHCILVDVVKLASAWLDLSIVVLGVCLAVKVLQFHDLCTFHSIWNATFVSDLDHWKFTKDEIDGNKVNNWWFALIQDFNSSVD